MCFYCNDGRFNFHIINNTGGRIVLDIRQTKERPSGASREATDVMGF